MNLRMTKIYLNR